jgi:hypothetical protein
VIQELGRRQHKIFSAALLRNLVAVGRWAEALDYLSRYQPLPPVDVEANALFLFLSALRIVASIAAMSSSRVVDVRYAEEHRRQVALLAPICRRSSKLSVVVVEDNETMHRPNWGRLLSYI